MIKVMVVEDEPPIAKSIKQLIEQFSNDVKVTHIAINGQRALQALEEDEFDIVFSDISMPVMGGIELCKIINQLYPNIRTFIISGYQDFEYARSAIRYGVSAYLLKPITPEAISEALSEAIEEIKKYKKEAEREYLVNILNNETTPDFDNQKMAASMLVCAGVYPHTSEEGLLPGRILFDIIDIEEEMRLLMNGSDDFICLTGRSVAERIIVFNVDTIERVFEIANQLFYKMTNLTAEKKIPVNICICGELLNMNKLSDVFKQLRKSLKRKMPLFASSVIIMGEDSENTDIDCNAYKNNLIAALQTQNFDKIDRCTDALISFFVDTGAKHYELVMHLEKLLINYFDSIFNLNKIEELKNEMLSVLSNSLYVEEFIGEFSQLLKDAIQPENALEKIKSDSLCDEIAAFIRENYKKNISSTDISNKFGISAIRLAKQFKLNYGMTFSEYLNNFRIETAKAIMREDKNAMIKEISSTVGFNDQYYFSKIFKKITGIWPTQYLKQ